MIKDLHICYTSSCQKYILVLVWCPSIAPEIHGLSSFPSSVSSDVPSPSFVTSFYLAICVSPFIVFLLVRVHNTRSVHFHSLIHPSIHSFILVCTEVCPVFITLCYKPCLILQPLCFGLCYLKLSFSAKYDL